jgi:glucose/arabinose dehydrogenase
LRRKTISAGAVLVIALGVSVFAISQLLNQPASKTEFRYEANVAFPNLSFELPVGLCSSTDGTGRLFVVGQMGLIYVFQNNANATAANIFLNITSQVHLGGFLSLALHPNFSQNGYFYVNYLADNPLRTIIAQYSVSQSNPNQADNGSEKILMEIPQLYPVHNGGQLAFGLDGYLYIALGDGGPQGDPNGNAQNCSTLFGKILRVDVDRTSENLSYAIPSDNPFVGNSRGFREEIYAYGFRNPWKFSFDAVTGVLFAGDVGQDRMEEIDNVKNGGNYGWNIMEGTLVFAGGNQTGLKMPIWAYGRDQGNATIGGFVYRGANLTGVVGSYIYGDYVSGRIWAFSNYQSGNPVNRELLKIDFNITSFGLDEKNELYICAQDGKIYELKEYPVNS